MATGRSDFPNQVNNCLAFPGLFRGVLDVRARRITDEMAMAAARELAACAEAPGLSEDRILADMADEHTAPRVAVAVARAAQDQGVAALSIDADEVYRRAREAIGSAQAAAQLLCRGGIIPVPPQA